MWEGRGGERRGGEKHARWQSRLASTSPGHHVGTLPHFASSQASKQGYAVKIGRHTAREVEGEMERGKGDIGRKGEGESDRERKCSVLFFNHSATRSPSPFRRSTSCSTLPHRAASTYCLTPPIHPVPVPAVKVAMCTAHPSRRRRGPD